MWMSARAAVPVEIYPTQPVEPLHSMGLVDTGIQKKIYFKKPECRYMILPGNVVQLPSYKDFLLFWAPSGVSPCLQLLLKNPPPQSLNPELYLPASREELEGIGTLRAHPICLTTCPSFIPNFWLLAPTPQL